MLSRSSLPPRPEELALEIQDLRSRLQEAEETLRAIREGEVDALVVQEDRSDKVYTLKSADRSYLLMIEGMRQGAVSLTSDGRILYCNRGFARLLQRSPENVTGGTLADFVVAESRPLLETLLRRGWTEGGSQGEAVLLAADGTGVPAFLDFSTLALEEGVFTLHLVVADLTEQKRIEALVASEDLTRSMLEQAADAIVVCNEEGVVVCASRAAHELCGDNPMLRPFEAVLPLVYGGSLLQPPGGSEADRRLFSLDPVLSGGRLQGVEVRLDRAGRDLLLSAGPLRDAGQRIGGCVITLTDITERRQAEERLRLLYGEARAANEAKDQFLAALSHELRTPLAPVMAVVSKLEADERLPPDVHDALAMAHRNIGLEARLIDDLLDLTRIARGKLELEPRVTDLRQVLAQAIETCCGGEIAAGRLRVVEELAAPDHRAWVDPSRLAQVFWNLLNNAVKFTPAGGTIHIRSWAEACPGAPPEPGLAFAIADTGIGILPEQLPQIFGAFDQGGEGTTRRFGGLGLGLTISRAIVERHGGSLTADSAGSGQGATFTLRIPVGAAAARAVSAGGAARPEQAAESAGGAGTGAHVLLVEDHADTAQAMADLLSALGHRVTVAGTVAAALDAARAEERIDLVVSDLGLPDGNGQDLMRELAGRYGLRGIALSGYGMEQDVRRSHEAGFARHLTKPVDAETFKSAILQALAGEGPHSRSLP